MKVALGISIFIISTILAVYNVSRNERKEINGPTLSLIFSAFVGVALLANLKFNLLGFDSSQLDEKVAEANSARNEAVAAKEIAQKSLAQTKEVYALNLLRTGLLPSTESLKKDREYAREMLKDAYGTKYLDKVNDLKNRQLVPYDFKP